MQAPHQPPAAEYYSHYRWLSEIPIEGVWVVRPRGSIRGV